ncbi:hypothetical protein BH23CHL7_BH23CHL7_16250 [soil metagenome]
MIDRAVLDELAHSIGDDAEFLRELVDAYLDDAPAQIASIRAGLAEGNVELVNRAAHTLKSNSATVGALSLAQMCRELESMTQPASTDPAALAGHDFAARADGIAGEFERVKSDLNAIVPTGAA